MDHNAIVWGFNISQVHNRMRVSDIGRQFVGVIEVFQKKANRLR